MVSEILRFFLVFVGVSMYFRFLQVLSEAIDVDTGDSSSSSSLSMSFIELRLICNSWIYESGCFSSCSSCSSSIGFVITDSLSSLISSDEWGEDDTFALKFVRVPRS